MTANRLCGISYLDQRKGSNSRNMESIQETEAKVMIMIIYIYMILVLLKLITFHDLVTKSNTY